MIGILVVAVLAVLIFIGLKNKKKLAVEGKKAADEKAKATEAFWASVNLDEELDNIFSVLEKSGATVSNFEKGLDHFGSKAEKPLKREEVLPNMKKALFARAFSSDNFEVAKTVAVGYFIRDVVEDKMMSEYIRFAVSRNGYHTSEMVNPFIQALYGVAGHAYNYQFNRKHNNLQPESYQAITPEVFKTVIETSDVLKSYTDSDPFAIEATREQWAKDLYDSPMKLVRSSKLGSVLDNEKYIDEMCYLAYTILREDQENSVENVSVAEIAVAYTDFLKEIYDRINH